MNHRHPLTAFLACAIASGALADEPIDMTRSDMDITAVIFKNCKDSARITSRSASCVRRQLAAVPALDQDTYRSSWIESEALKRLQVVQSGLIREELEARGREEERIEAERNARLRAKCARQGLTSGEPVIGMSVEQARYCGWGQPEDVTTYETAKSITQVWTYRYGRALHLTNGRVSLIVR